MTHPWDLVIYFKIISNIPFSDIKGKGVRLETGGWRVWILKKR